ncbi:casein kinase II subunit beta-like protein 1 [Sarcoptes scabiei]|uniref:Casein kinase II subunit beta n=1 Tax=Sarcoptes scabiei TaxID=52283 RepID=A0A132AMC1_SARSC|nr:casein kinase II subunit beta-like protein 1 [Sarcoptes scabiei]
MSDLKSNTVENVNNLNDNLENKKINQNSFNRNDNLSSAAFTNDSTSDSITKWTKKFCSFDRNRFLCMVDADYIRDSFNLIGLENKVSHYQEALGLILDEKDEQEWSSENSFDGDEFDSDRPGREIQILSAAENLYGLIHARFILTDSGLDRMLTKFKKRQFGTCVRYYCNNAPMLPIGLSDKHGVHTVRLYCPRCRDIYVPQFSSKFITLDGAFFGTSFPHMFFMVYPSQRPLPSTLKFVPKLFGFRINEKAYEYQYQQNEAAEKAKQPAVFCRANSNQKSANNQNDQHLQPQ